MGAWSTDSRSHVSTMSDGDFRSTERSVTVERDGRCGSSTSRPDGTVDRAQRAGRAARGRGARRRGDAPRGADASSSPSRSPTPRAQGVLFSVHLKATMMKVSDPIIFGHAVRAFFPGSERPGLEPERRPRRAAAGDRDPLSRDGPALAMVDSDRGITNLHVPSDVIIDASMPAAIRASGQMWNADGEQQDTKFVIPDHSYAPLYAETVDHCREHGAFDPATMGTTPNVGLMAQAGRGVRLARQDVRDLGRRARSAWSTTRGDDAARARGRPRATSGACARRKDAADPGLGPAGRRARARDRRAGRVLARRDARRTTRSCCKKVRPALERARHRRPARSRSCDVADADPLHARARPRAARTRSRSPATCSATT